MKEKHRCSIALDKEFHNYILANKGRMSTSQYFNILMEEYFELKGLNKEDYQDKE